MQNGLIHVYIGDGKGKSTAAFGLALRCYGCGGRVQVLQFLKTRLSGEVSAVENLSDDRFLVLRFENEHGIIFNDARPQDLECLKKDVQTAYASAYSSAISGKWDLLVLDEILWALHFELISLEQLLSLMRDKSASTELVLTGGYAPEAVLQHADYITQMCCKRHPYQKGIEARKYIEF